MEPRGLFTAALIDSTAKAVASSAVTRMQEELGEEALGSWGFRELVADAELRLRNLSEALAAGRAEILELDARWLATSYASRGMSTDMLQAMLRALRAELASSLPEDSAGQADLCLDRALEAVRAAPRELPSLLEAEAPHVDLARRFLLAVLEGKRVQARSSILEALDAGVGVADLHRHVIVKSQAEIGRMWQLGEVHIAEEHLGTRIVEEVLALLRARMPVAEDTGRSVLVASVQGNLHDTGARMVADHFEMAGWRALLLGADVPSLDLVLGVRDFGVDLVALSAGTGLHVRATAQLVAAMREHHPGVPVLVGGGPFLVLGDLWRVVGADGSALDAEAAVEEGRRLVGAAGAEG